MVGAQAGYSDVSWRRRASCHASARPAFLWSAGTAHTGRYDGGHTRRTARKTSRTWQSVRTHGNPSWM